MHFQIMDAPSPLASDGLPFVIRSFDSEGSIPPLDQIDPTQPIPIGPELSGHHELVSPMIRQVVDYPAGLISARPARRNPAPADAHGPRAPRGGRRC